MAIVITSQIPNVTYNEFLAQSSGQPFTVWKTRIISSAANQLEQPTAVQYQDANGDLKQKVICPIIDPYQLQKGLLSDDTEYTWNGFTSLQISTLQGNATVQFEVYPKKKFNATELLNGKPLISNQPESSPYVFTVTNTSATPVSNVVIGNAYSYLGTDTGVEGTINYVAKFTPTGVAIGNSIIYDNGAFAGIGTSSPAAVWDITGASGATLRIADGNQGVNKVLTSDGGGQAKWGLAIDSQPYTPGISNGNNVSSATANVCQWMRIGNSYVISGSLSITNILGSSTETDVSISVPQGVPLSVAGTFFDDATFMGGAIKLVAGKAYFVFYPVGTGAKTYYFTLMYTT